MAVEAGEGDVLRGGYGGEEGGELRGPWREACAVVSRVDFKEDGRWGWVWGTGLKVGELGWVVDEEAEA